MADHGCINGALDGADYSSPVPVIGLYIAAGSLLLTLIMLYDIAAGFRSNKRWLPCKYVTLNSVTLSLLAIAAKLPVDLTTAMPRPVDQLSKLTATSLVCMTMGFLYPSLGNSSQSEGTTNMVALTIFVITIVVNMCIQLSTGVIVLFVVEHILIMLLMLVLLCILWHSSWEINTQKRYNNLRNKAYIGRNGYSMRMQLKYCYQRTFLSNPQLVACRSADNFVVGGLCLFSSVILIQASIRSLILKRVEFCFGSSDYSWSMLIIVLTQILTVLVGCFATSLRCLSMVNYSDLHVVSNFRRNKGYYVIDDNPILWSVSVLDKCKRCIIHICLLTLLTVQLLFVHPIILLRKYTGGSEELPSKLDGDPVGTGGPEQLKWDIRRCSEHVDRWMQICKTEPCHHLNGLILQTSRRDIRTEAQHYMPTSLRIVVLVRLAQVLLPKHLHEAFVRAYSEAIEVIRFVVKPRKESDVLEQSLWKGPGFTCFLPEIFSQASVALEQPDLERAMFILPKLVDLLTVKSLTIPFVNRMVEEVLQHILNAHRASTSSNYLRLSSVEDLRFSRIEDLSASMGQVFVDYLHSLLAEFPIAVVKLLQESPAEEFEERLKLVMKYCCQLEPLADKIQWLFPEGWRTRML